MKINYFSAASIAVFVLNPLLSIIVLLSDKRANIKVIWFVLSLFMALMAYNQMPDLTMDISRYYIKYQEMLNMGYLEVWSENEFNLFILSYIKTLQYLNLNQEFISFFCVFISYYLSFLSLQNIKIEESKKLGVGITICLFLSIPFLASASGLRNGLASAICLYTLSSLNQRGKVSSFALLALASVVHSYIILVVLIYSISSFRKYYRLFKYAFILSPVFVVIDISFLLPLFNDYFDNVKLYQYVAEGHLETEVESKGGMAMLGRFLFSFAPIYVSYLYLLIKKWDDNSFLFIISILGVFSMLFWQFGVISGRYLSLLGYLTTFYFLSNYNAHNKNFARLFLLLFAFSNFLNLFWELYRFREVYLLDLSFIIKPMFFTILMY